MTGALHAKSAREAIGFELCGAAAASCRYASGTVVGSQVTLPGDGQPVTRVRYAWSDTPAINLVDDAGLPVGPFETSLS
ncbi:hypothetical protein [Sphingomonas sp. Ant20]|uniref:hypothetical protein n=1 Tax=Sphingomonas sp. Ant20 TaxID=104605 RepID=UPI000ACA4C29|nr:hypothetical protein [Sphingomonas sp. Ant20]